MGYSLLQINEKWEGQGWEILLNTPPSNILTAKMIAELEEAFLEAQKKRDLKVVILAGQGNHFSYGASVEEHRPGEVEKMLPVFHRVIGTVLNSSVPTIARVSGLCLGGGFEVALACTMIFADETAQFAVPEIQLGVFPPVAALLLPMTVGTWRANRIILTGEKIPAKKMSEWGVQVSAPGALIEDVVTFVEKNWITKSAASLRIAHRAARRSLAQHYQQNIGVLESLYLKELMSTHDAVEGIRAFTEKRSPQWKNT